MDYLYYTDEQKATSHNVTFLNRDGLIELSG